jgi:hypothetical protein
MNFNRFFRILLISCFLIISQIPYGSSHNLLYPPEINFEEVRANPSTQSVYQGDSGLEIIYNFPQMDFTIEDILSSSSTPADLMSIDDLWYKNYNGTGITVAVIDTGVDTDHPALKDKIIDAVSFVDPIYGYSGEEGPEDYHGHGTFVSSLILGNDSTHPEYSGMGFGANLISVKVVQVGNPNIITSKGLVAALNWSSLNPEVDIINLSISEPEEGIGTDVLEAAVELAVKRGKIVVASASNNGYSSNSNDYYTIGSPGSNIHTIAVGATDNNRNMASFSGNGPTYGGNFKPDVVAPGVNINSARLGGGYISKSGTSFSTPLVTGVIASLLSSIREENRSVGLVKAGLLAGADDLNIPIYRQGNGFVNASRSLEIIHNSSLQMDHIIPNQLPEPLHSSLPAGEQIHTNLYAVSSKLSKWSISSIIGNISNYAIIKLDTGDSYTQILQLTIKTHKTTIPGKYTGMIHLISPNNQTKSIPIEVNIEKPAKYRLLLDLLHTPWDSVISSRLTGILERSVRTDLTGIVQMLRSFDVWTEEITEGSLTSEILSRYDILFMPSAFTTPYPNFYDHNVSRSTTLTKDELFAIHEFKEEGGKFIIDFAGVSSNDDYFTTSVLPDDQSLRLLLSLFGVQLEGNLVQDINTLAADPINSTNYYSSTYTVGGSNGLLYGFPFSRISDEISSVGVIDGRSKAIIVNSRNWRDGARMAKNSLSESFAHGFIEWLLNNVITSVRRESKTLNEITIQFLELLDPNEIEFKLINNGNEIPYYLYIDINTMKIKFEADEGDEVEVRFTHNFTYAQFTSLVDYKNPELDPYRDNTEYSYVEINNLFNRSDYMILEYLINDHSTINEGALRVSNIDDVGYVTMDNNLISLNINSNILNHFNFSIKATQIYSIPIEIIDENGNYAIHTIAITVSPEGASISSDPAFNINLLLIIPGAILILVVILKNRKTLAQYISFL